MHLDPSGSIFTTTWNFLIGPSGNETTILTRVRADTITIVNSTGLIKGGQACREKIGGSVHQIRITMETTMIWITTPFWSDLSWITGFFSMGVTTILGFDSTLYLPSKMSLSMLGQQSLHLSCIWYFSSLALNRGLWYLEIINKIHNT